MPTSSGRGSSPGEALQAALDAAGGASWQPPAGRKAVSVHARVRALTRSGRGYSFLLGAGLNPRQHTLVDWLSGITPGRESTRKINQAYESYWQSLGRLVRGIPRWVTTGHTHITGLVLTEGTRPRHRGVDEAPLVIENGNGEWEEVTRIYVHEDDPEALWRAFVEDVILNDLDFSVLDFPGNDYTIELLS